MGGFSWSGLRKKRIYNNNNSYISNPPRVIMPTVTITMSEKAYDVYRTWIKGDRSNKVSASILQWNALKDVKWTVKE